MKLIIIVIAFLTEQHLGPLERLRDWKWFQAFADRLHGVFGERTLWSGPLGVLVTLAVPLFVARVLLGYLDEHFWLGWVAAQIALLLYCLGPRDLIRLVDEHLRVLASGDAEKLKASSQSLTGHAELAAEQRPQAVLESIFAGAQQQLFAIYFWFVVLGAAGALLVRGLAELRTASSTRALGFAHAAESLYAWLCWAPARLFAFGFALAGSLTHTFDRWSFQQTMHAEENDNLVKAAGLGALQFDRGGQALSSEEERDWVEQARGLVARNFLVWLTTLGVMTLGGWLV